MAQKRNAKREEACGAALSRTDRLLAMILLGQQSSATLWDKIRVLRSAGLTNTEIGGLLGITGSAVGKSFYDATKRGTAKKRTPRR